MEFEYRGTDQSWRCFSSRDPFLCCVDSEHFRRETWQSTQIDTSFTFAVTHFPIFRSTCKAVGSAHTCTCLKNIRMSDGLCVCVWVHARVLMERALAAVH
uniref:Uncharacterized protein n=1 Tax=Anabas testudineus TaxID=64144 RepID=A0A3Q1IU77_ANATE